MTLRRFALRVARFACVALLPVTIAGQGGAQDQPTETITGAVFDTPTDRYAHCVLGDCLEWAALEILSQRADGQEVSRRFNLYPGDFVFEDLEPRLWDVTGDGAPEVVVVRSSVTKGAALVVFNVDGVLAETAPIGQANRWLAPVGAADFDGDGRVEVAFVDRPHLAKVLRIFEWDGLALVPDTRIEGLTNHRIGQDFISGGVRDCGAGPELVTADAEWQRVVLTSYDGEWRLRDGGAFSSARLNAVMACAD